MLSINLFKKHIFLEFMKNILKVGATFIAFAIVLDLFEEISFFKESIYFFNFFNIIVFIFITI